MEDEKIYDLYFKRDENAIIHTNEKYGRWCRGIAKRILGTDEDVEECVSDTYFNVWNNIPPQRPKSFRAWIGRITRNLAIGRYRKDHAEKRGSGQVMAVLDELSECVSGNEGPESAIEAEEIRKIINAFLQEQSETKRAIFMRRYWFCESVEKISKVYGYKVSKTSGILFRMRRQLRTRLEEGGIAL